MIWGASFAALFLVLLILALIQFFLLRRSLAKSPPEFSVPPSVTSGETMEVELELSIPLLFPGFRILWLCRYSWAEGRRTIGSARALSRGNHHYPVVFPPSLRGVYRGPSGILKLEDLFGFISLTLYRGEPLTLYVCPRMDGWDFSADEIISGGKTATDERERVRSDELLEVRKYYPGDDARRINWKMFAATGEMFLRIGEEIPPPSGEAMICLIPDSPQAGASRISSEWCDRLVDIFLALVLRFSEKGCRVLTLAVPGEPVPFDTGKPDRLLRDLAGITPESPAPVINGNNYVYGIALPGAKGLDRFIDAGKAESALFLVTAPPRNENVNLVKTLLFRDEPLGGIRKMRREISIQSDVLEENISRLKRRGKGSIHVHTV